VNTNLSAPDKAEFFRVKFESEFNEMTINTLIKIFAVLVILAGGVWILQGINILPGSYMSGNPDWVRNGGIAVAIGAALLWSAMRK